MKLSKSKKYYFKKGVIWLLLSTAISFIDEFIQENTNNNIILNISTIAVLFMWLIFISYCFKFYIKSAKFKWIN